MAVETACQTPGTLYDTRIEGRRISVAITLPANVPPPAAASLEATIHNALELALAPLFAAVCECRAAPPRTGRVRERSSEEDA